MSQAEIRSTTAITTALTAWMCRLLALGSICLAVSIFASIANSLREIEGATRVSSSKATVALLCELGTIIALTAFSISLFRVRQVTLVGEDLVVKGFRKSAAICLADIRDVEIKWSPPPQLPSVLLVLREPFEFGSTVLIAPSSRAAFDSLAGMLRGFDVKWKRQ